MQLKNVMRENASLLPEASLHVVPVTAGSFFQCLIVWKSNIPAKAIIGFDNSIACPVIYCGEGLLDSNIIARMGYTSTEIQGIRMFAAIVFNGDWHLKCWRELLLTSDNLAVLV